MEKIITQLDVECLRIKDYQQVADVDLSLLNALHSFGSVRNLRDRRKDVYELKLLTADQKTETILPEDMDKIVEKVQAKKVEGPLPAHG